MDKTYEMLWDCTHCGTRKNLGLTHQYCPSCGGPQDAERRYFPADAEKIAVEDHAFVGADLRCTYCQTNASRAASHCGGCGAPLEGAPEVARRQDQVQAGQFAGESVGAAQQDFAAQAAGQPQAPATAQAAKPSGSKTKFFAIGCGGLLLVLCIVAAVLMLWKREGALQVSGHTWEREISVERFGPVNDSDWCDQTPSGARVSRRAQEVRSQRQIEDGQDCKTRRVDNGDGTYTERQECTTKYREEPVYDAKCYYTVDRWSVARTESASGASLGEEPHWPAVQLARTGNCIGCEREGNRSESYVVQFAEPETGEEATCDFEQARWTGFAQGSTWTGEMSVVGSVLDCSSLKPQ